MNRVQVATPAWLLKWIPAVSDEDLSALFMCELYHRR